MKIHKHHIIHKHLWGIILCSLCFSCQQKAREMTDVRVLHPREAIETDIDVLTDSIAYIPLETSDECLLDNILSAKRDGGCFFVQDGKGLYAFDGTGRFLNEIGRRGNGPEEYLYMDCYALDRTNKLVYVVSNVQKKIFRYTYQGKFHSALYVDPHDANIASLTVCNDSVLLAYYPLPNKAADSGCAYARLDIAGNRLASHKLIDAVTVHSGAAHYPLLYHPMAFFQGEWLMIVPLSNEVYAYDGREITGKYVIDVPDMTADKAFWQAHKGLEFSEARSLLREKGLGLGITAIAATDGRLLLSLNNRQTLAWDGKSCRLIDNILMPDVGVQTELLSGGGCSDDYLGYFEASFLCSRKEQAKESGNPTFLRLSSYLKEEDNPVLFRYHFKKKILGF